MRERPLDPKVEYSLARGDAAGPSPPSGDDTLGEVTLSSAVTVDVRGSLCCCNAAVGGIFVTCLMNVAMAR
jgi:hypothetical protein